MTAIRLLKEGFHVIATVIVGYAMFLFILFCLISSYHWYSFSESDKELLTRDVPREYSDKLHVLVLDITKEDQIFEMYHFHIYRLVILILRLASVQTYLSSNSLSLYALINNAGVGVLGPIETVDWEKWKWGMNVNFFGHVLMTRTFLPLLREGKEKCDVFICTMELI